MTAQTSAATTPAPSKVVDLALPPAQPLTTPVSVFAVAERLLELGGEMEAAKLESLVYFSQAWHLAATGLPMFNEPIEARAEGPVVAVLHEAIAGAEVVAPGAFRELLAAASTGVEKTDNRHYVGISVLS